MSSRALLDACARLGLDTGQILQAARLDPVTVADPDARIPIEQVGALWLKAYELSNDPNLALHAIEVLPFGAYRVIDLLDQLPSPADIVGRVREAIGAELRGGNPKLESIARRLAMSPRTLQRRLRDQDVIFNDVLDAMRFRAAKAYLAQGDIAGTKVAYLLGFAEQSSFNRAFKRGQARRPPSTAAGPSPSSGVGELSRKVKALSPHVKYADRDVSSLTSDWPYGHRRNL